MNTQFILAAYWGVRKEEARACAERMVEFFKSVSQWSPITSHWYELGRSKRDALSKPAALNSIDYWHRKFSRQRQSAEAGYSIGLWNGHDNDSGMGISVRCGAHSEFGKNCVVIYCHPSSGLLGTHCEMSLVLSSVARVWQPDWAGLMSSKGRDMRHAKPGQPFIDWMIYLSDELLPEVPKLKPPARCERIDDLGTLIVVQPEPTDPTNRDHLQNIERVQTALKKVWTVADYE
jgi:hypothetical protein